MAGTSVGNALGSYVLHHAIDSSLGPIATKVYYTASAADPVSVPSVEALVEAKLRGWIDPGLANALAIVQGVDLGAEQLPGNIVLNPDFEAMVASGWSDVVRSRQSILSIADTLELWVRQDISGDQADALLRRNGVVDPDTVLRLKLLEAQIPEPADILPAYLRGLLSRADASQLLSRRGYSLDVFEPLLVVQSGTVPANQALEYGYRLSASDDEFSQLLSRSGVFDPAEQAKYRTLYQKLPSRSDVTTWLMRNVFDDQYVTDFRLNEGFEERYWARFSTVLTAGGWSHDYAYLDYAAHWQIPAISQLAEMVQRLRPGSVDPALEFRVEDFLRVLAEQDIAPYYRERLLATSYRPLPIRFLRAAYQTDNLTERGVSEAYQDQGYSAATAEFMTQTEKLIKARARAAASRGWTPAAIAHAVVTNQTTPDQANFLMHELGFSTAETTNMLQRAQAEYAGRFVTAGAARVASSTVRAVLRGYSVGTVTAQLAQLTLVSLGWREDSARAVLQATELDVKTSQVLRAQAAVRRAFLKGEIDATGALNLLARAGMDPSRAQPEVAAWQLELTPARKHVSAGAIRKGILAGVLSVEQGRSALTNLGYSDPDATLLASEMAFDLRAQEVKLAKTRDKNAVSAARLYDQLLSSNAKLQAKIRGALKRTTPVAKLQAWFAASLIDESYFRHRMSQMGYGDDAIERYLDDAVAKRDKPKKGQPPASTGNGQSPPDGA